MDMNSYGGGHHHIPSNNHHHHHHNNYSPHIDVLPIGPLPSNNNHRRYQQHSSSAPSIRSCCCCLILLFSFLALLLLTVALVTILAVKPVKPQFDLRQVGVQYINLTAPAVNTASTASLSLGIRMLFTAKNENKVGIKYGVSTFHIMYREIPLGRGTIPRFYQPAHTVRQVQTTVTVGRVILSKADAGDLVRDASLNDLVGLRISGDVNANIRILGFTSPPSLKVSHF